MKKEMSIILISFRSILNYKSSVLLLMLQASIQIMISVFLWTYIYQSNQINIAGYDFTSMVQYYLGTIIFHILFFIQLIGKSMTMFIQEIFLAY